MGVGTMREPTDAETMAKRLELAREEVSIRLGRVQEKQKERYVTRWRRNFILEKRCWCITPPKSRKGGEVTLPLALSLCDATEDSVIKLQSQAEV